jgi:hypothetical protein
MAGAARIDIDQLDEHQLRRLAELLRPYLVDATPALLDTRDAAARLGLHGKTLARLARTGRVVGAQRVGRGWRFDPEQLAIRPAATNGRPPGRPLRPRASAGHTPADSIRDGGRAAW